MTVVGAAFDGVPVAAARAAVRGADDGVRGIDADRPRRRCRASRSMRVPSGVTCDGLELDLGRDAAGQRVAGHGPAGGRVEWRTRDAGRPATARRPAPRSGPRRGRPAARAARGSAGAAVDGVRRRFRSGPDVRPVGARDREPDPVPPGELPGRRVDLDLELVHLPGVSGSGSVSELRRVALSIPFATRCDVPSGATSDRLTAKPITVAVEDTCSTARGRPTTKRPPRAGRSCRGANRPRRDAGRPEGRTGGRLTRARGHPDRRDVLEVVRVRPPRRVTEKSAGSRLSVRSPAPGGGQSLSARHSPAASRRSGTGFS